MSVKTISRGDGECRLEVDGMSARYGKRRSSRVLSCLLWIICVGALAGAGGCGKNKMEFLVTDSNTGSPLEGATVVVERSKDDGGWGPIPGLSSLTTDRHGKVIAEWKGKYDGYSVTVKMNEYSNESRGFLPSEKSKTIPLMKVESDLTTLPEPYSMDEPPVRDVPSQPEVVDIVQPLHEAPVEGKSSSDEGEVSASPPTHGIEEYGTKEEADGGEPAHKGTGALETAGGEKTPAQTPREPVKETASQTVNQPQVPPKAEGEVTRKESPARLTGEAPQKSKTTELPLKTENPQPTKTELPQPKPTPLTPPKKPDLPTPNNPILDSSECDSKPLSEKIKCLLQKEDYERVVTQDISSLKGEYRAEALFRQALAYSALGKRTEAIKTYKEITTGGSRLAGQALGNMGAEYMALGDWRAATENLTRALENELTRTNQGLVYYNRGKITYNLWNSQTNKTEALESAKSDLNMAYDCLCRANTGRDRECAEITRIVPVIEKELAKLAKAK
jgi:hypothetical protein